MNVFAEKRIILGVTGSIAAFKAADLSSKLTQAGALVDVILTEAGEKFITPLTFQSVTGRRAYVEKDLWGSEAHVLHVGLGRSADLLVIAPCTADTIAKLAHGIADNLLTVTALAAHCPLLIAPAMDGGMYEHAATQENVAKLTQRGAVFVGPAEGHLASGLSGRGRMVEPAEIIGHIRLLLARNGRLAGRKIVVTAGGTQEPLDPVRVLTNRSSGKQGYAIAESALASGADVVLVSAPTALSAPVGARLVSVQSAEDMLDAVLEECADADALVMAAAAADFRPKNVSKDKMKKREGIPQVELEAAPDILKTVAGLRRRPAKSQSSPGEPSPLGERVEGSGMKRLCVVVGFAAESRDLLENAAEKLKSKGLDFIVANDISAKDSGFSTDTNRVTILFNDGQKEALPLMSKSEVAEHVVDHISELLE